ncbi:MAG: hypothetical protein ACRDY6_13670 [Acidimicrobiia bacterium]
MRRILPALAALSCLAFAPVASSQTQACFGAPADYVNQFGADYPEPRAFVDSQAWWLEGAGDATSSIDDAMRASHLHYGKCFPFMETWNESGLLTEHVKLQMHEFVGGHSTTASLLAFVNGGEFNGKVGLGPWYPTQVDETRYVQKSRDPSTITKCGRLEQRGHLEGISNNGGERMFNSYGWQSLFDCKPGRTQIAARGPAIIFRGWYEQADYSNITFLNDFRGEQGFRASQMDDPVVGDLKLSFALAAGANRWLVSINPNVHGGSFGSWVARGSGTSFTLTIPDSAIPSGLFRVMAVGCERVGSSSANPIGGQNCGVGVVPFLGDGTAPPPDEEPPPPPPPPEEDTQAPTAPSGLHSSGTTQTSVTLAWNASSDNVGVDHYNLYSRGIFRGTTTALEFTYTGEACGTNWGYGVEAVDAAGNVSDRPWIRIATDPC